MQCGFSGNKDHPRLCGEKSIICCEVVTPIGSPPPMRGKGRQSVSHALDSGITPAYAGKREIVPYARPTLKDHPRLCGEKVSVSLKIFSDLGSPPPMRGKVRVAQNASNKGGITPAYAGKRPSFVMTSSAAWDHPRLCGEKANGEKYGWGRVGSPPPMRGKETYACSKPNRSGITPAYAGKSIQRYHS